MKYAPIALVLLAACPGPKRPEPPPPPLRLVVTVVVDQLPQWAYAKKSLAATDGLGRIVAQGRHWTARYPYAATQTAPGHAALGTGAAPSVTGILGNEWWRRELGREARAADDGLGGPPSANLLRVDGLADVLAREHPDARAVAVALKDRSALLSLGHTGLSVWYSDQCTCMISNAAAPPAWLGALPAIEPRLAEPWLPLDAARLAELSGGPDDAPGELGIPGWGPTFPHDFATSPEPNHALTDAPLGNAIVIEAALAALDGEALGTDDVADYLVVSLSAHDYVGHAWGQDSWESWDTWLRLDHQLAALTDALDARVGDGRWALVLTSDHGAPPLPERTPDPHRMRYEDIERVAEAAAATVAGAGDWIASARYPTLYLTEAARLRQDRPALVDAVVAAVAAIPGIERADRASDFVGGCDARTTDDARAICLSLDGERSGEIFYAPAVGTTLDKLDWTDAISHGSLHDDDREVPLVIVAPGVEAGEAGDASALQIAATVAGLLGVTPPPAADPRSLIAGGR